MRKPKFELSSDTYKTELEIMSISGTESISTLFSIKVGFKIVESVANKLNHASLTQDDIKILVTNISNRSDYTIKGVFIQVEEEFKTLNSPKPLAQQKKYKYYSATLVPAVWRQCHNQSYDIFTNTTVPDILRGELSNDLNLNHQLSLNGDYPVKDFICQYSESNFQFISRLAEHWGVYYYIDHDQDGKLILADDTLYDMLPIGVINLDQNKNPSQNYNSIRNLKRQFNTVPTSVVITETNPDQAREGFQGTAGKLTNGKASINMVNEGVDNKKEAEDLAQIRLEELQSQAVVYSGTSGLACITPGFILTVRTPTEEIANPYCKRHP
ncbi:contractile injection system protein, VgrG/Pvc8 family [Pseudomonas sp. HK3]